MYSRFVERRIRTALTDTRVVVLVGPRQAGKTTLAQWCADNHMNYFTLDNATTLEAAQEDPSGFVRGLDRAVIDEVQRAPALLLAIKESVDADTRPGRFLLTGSANLMTLPRVADSLAGRMEVIDLLPLSQCEIHGRAPTFLNSAFRGEIPSIEQTAVAEQLIDIVLAGGYPEALTRKSSRRRSDWYQNYINAIIQRDVQDVADINKAQQMPQLLQALAHHSGRLINYSAIGSALDMNHITTRKYTGVFEQLFLVRRVKPWFNNTLKRLTKTPKLHFLDTGLLASLQNLSKKKLLEQRTLFGPLLETFVLTELLKLSSSSDQHIEFSHMRDKQQNEVDIVMQNQDESIVGIEVKSAATVTRADFTGLRKLAEGHKKQFALGLVLYDHNQIVPFSNNLYAVPISALWH